MAFDPRTGQMLPELYGPGWGGHASYPDFSPMAAAQVMPGLRPPRRVSPPVRQGQAAGFAGTLGGTAAAQSGLTETQVPPENNWLAALYGSGVPMGMGSNPWFDVSRLLGGGRLRQGIGDQYFSAMPGGLNLYGGGG